MVVDIANTNLSQEQTQRILENYVIRFSEFEKLLLYDLSGKLVFSTRLQKEDPDLPNEALIRQALSDREVFSEAYLSEDLTPVIWFLLPMKGNDRISGALAAQIDLMRMWEWVSNTKLGKRGYVSVVDAAGKVVASGDPHYKKAILSSEEPVAFQGFQRTEESEFPTVRETVHGPSLMSVRAVSESRLGSSSWHSPRGRPSPACA